MRRFLGFVFLPVVLLSVPASAQLLRLNHAFNLDRSAVASHRAALPDTVKLLAVMVDFQEDNDTRTSGTGKFNTIYEYDYGTEILDPMPHDRQYFASHLRFLENYVRKASGRRNIVRTDILDGVVTLSKQIREYTFLKGQPETPVANLAVEAWTLADAQFPQVDFSSYNMFVIFHAGRGRDLDLVSIQGFDPTPFDIPSLSFTLNSFKKHYGDEFSGIPVEGGSFHITNTAIIPTTDNREIPLIDGTRALLEMTINGLLAASFGTYAGLPDLFNTANGKTGIGRFGLMDGEGIFAYGGICPPEPSAWEKQFLGWTVAREAQPGTRNYELYASDSLSTPDILRVPITSKEYWLVENRQRDLRGNGQVVTVISGGREQQFRFPKDTTGFSNGDVSALKGVVVDVDDIDWSLPGGTVEVDGVQDRVNGGVLIWHIDELIVDAYLADNSVNSNPSRRGVDLEQAGGPQDIGVTVQTVFGSQTGTGSALDYWHRNNLSPVYMNVFGYRTSPNTRSNSGAQTHVTMQAFSGIGPRMSFDVALGDAVIEPAAGFPVDLSLSLSPGQKKVYPQTADLDGDGKPELIATAGWSTTDLTDGMDTMSLAKCRLFVVRENGQPFLPGADPVAAELSRPFNAGPPAIGDIDGDGRPEIVCVSASMFEPKSRLVISVYSATDANSDGRLDLLDEYVQDAYPSGAPHVFQCAFMHGQLVYAVRSGSDILLAVRGTSQRDIIIPGNQREVDEYALAELPADRVLVTNGRSAHVVNIQTGAEEQYTSYAIQSSGDHPMAAAADFDGDGRVEVMATGSKGLELISLSDDTNVPALTGNLPNSVPQASLFPTLAAADVDGDGRMDGLLTGAGSLQVLNVALASVDNYPLQLRPGHDLRASTNDAHALSVRTSANGDAIFTSAHAELTQIFTGARTADGFPVPVTHGASTALVRSGDGRLGIAVAGSDQQLYYYTTPTEVEARDLLWRSRFGDEHNSAQVAPSGDAPAFPATFFPQERCYNWPNPVYDQVTKIRFFVSLDASVTVKIYDVAGEKVDELHAGAIGGTDNEIDWNVRDVQSDIYLAHVEVNAGGQTASKIIKIAVVK